MGKITFNLKKDLLSEKIIARYGSLPQFCEKHDMSRPLLHFHLSGKSSTINTMLFFVNALNLNKDEMFEIFFTESK